MGNKIKINDKKYLILNKYIVEDKDRITVYMRIKEIKPQNKKKARTYTLKEIIKMHPFDE